MKLTKKSIIGFNDGFLDAAPLDDCADERQIVVDDHALQSVVINQYVDCYQLQHLFEFIARTIFCRK